jgi:hypothetical protein
MIVCEMRTVSGVDERTVREADLISFDQLARKCKLVTVLVE